jgi:hypothetical protein
MEGMPEIDVRRSEVRRRRWKRDVFNVCGERLGRWIVSGIIAGEVAEWLKAMVSKTIVRETVPGVQIPPSPP